MKKHLLTFIVFSSGALVMILELLASRLFAPYLGTSLPVWSALIAVILGCLSLGYWYGGKLADRGANWKVFSWFFFIASALVLITLFAETGVLGFLSHLSSNIYLTSIVAAIVLFGPVGVILGFVSPYAVRLRLTQLNESGQTVGNLYAWSTLGSIVGTLSAGFLLLPSLGHKQLLWLCVVSLFFLGFAAYFMDAWKKTLLAFLACICLAVWGSFIITFFKDQSVWDFDTQYNRILIDDSLIYQGRPVRLWKTDYQTAQSAMFLDDPIELVHDYTKYYDLFLDFKPDTQNALMIGGAAFSYPKYFLANYPDKKIDVVEIDGAAVQIAEQYFHLDPHHPNLQIFVADARPFLNQNKKKYDSIFIDAFAANATIPYQLTTLEFVRSVFASLQDDGAVIVNIISPLIGEKNKLLRSLYKIYATVFPKIYLFQMNKKYPQEQTQNIILVADKSLEPDSRNLSFWENEYSEPLDLTDLPLLTDNYAPSDYYALNIFD
jgi:spermidine synthase